MTGIERALRRMTSEQLAAETALLARCHRTQGPVHMSGDPNFTVRYDDGFVAAIVGLYRLYKSVSINPERAILYRFEEDGFIFTARRKEFTPATLRYVLTAYRVAKQVVCPLKSGPP